MPELTTITKTASQLKKGDLVVHPTGAVRGDVQGVEVKTKWTTVYINALPRERVLNETPYLVRVEQKTEEEKAAERREFSNRLLANNRAGAAANLAKQRDRMHAAVDSNSGTSWDELGSYLTAQATEKIWQRVDHVMAVAVDRGEPMDLFTAVTKVQDKIREGLSNYRAASQSTDVASNAIKAYEFDAQVAFLDRWIMM